MESTVFVKYMIWQKLPLNNDSKMRSKVEDIQIVVQQEVIDYDVHECALRGDKNKEESVRAGHIAKTR